jgi:hypothetical protein
MSTGWKEPDLKKKIYYKIANRMDQEADEGDLCWDCWTTEAGTSPEIT